MELCVSSTNSMVKGVILNFIFHAYTWDFFLLLNLYPSCTLNHFIFLNGERDNSEINCWVACNPERLVIENWFALWFWGSIYYSFLHSFPLSMQRDQELPCSTNYLLWTIKTLAGECAIVARTEQKVVHNRSVMPKQLKGSIFSMSLYAWSKVRGSHF